MEKTLKIQKEKGQEAKKFLLKKDWLDKTKILGKTQRYLIFPLTKDFDEKELLKKVPGGKIENKTLENVKKESGNLKEILKDVIPENKLEEVTRSFDVIGDIAILEIPKSLKDLEKSIAWNLKRKHPYLKVVAKKASKVTGTYRVRELEILTGENRTKTTYKEHGITMKMDLAKVYFTPRYSTERLRIANKIKKGEKVLVMFAGVGPFALVIAKQKPTTRITAIELNPAAYAYMKDNIRINRMGNIIKPIKGDVREVLPELGEHFDSIVMPFPEKNWDFLDLALKHANPNATIYFHAFIHDNDMKEKLEKIKEIAQAMGKKVKIKNRVRAGSYSSRTWRWAIDIQVE